MFRAINDWVIVKRDLRDKTTESGIIVQVDDDVQVLELTVTSATSLELEGRTVFALRHKVNQLTPNSDEKYGAVKLEDIIAVKDNAKTETKPSK